jgi:hypothetical protein
MLREIHELAAERIGGMPGGMLARQLNARRMGEVFAALMFLLEGWQVFPVWRG